jgi:hypothetical protein
MYIITSYHHYFIGGVILILSGRMYINIHPTTQDEYYTPDEVVVIGGDYIHPTTLKMSITPPRK